jgi:hypothetical protein
MYFRGGSRLLSLNGHQKFNHFVIRSELIEITPRCSPILPGVELRNTSRQHHRRKPIRESRLAASLQAPEGGRADPIPRRAGAQPRVGTSARRPHLILVNLIRPATDEKYPYYGQGPITSSLPCTSCCPEPQESYSNQVRGVRVLSLSGYD